ncbi:thiol reductant ABC exporter subunit CydD [Rheinheimera salexigens]|uniref:Thiol reductant ABC exporter subunit CydD n=1 Tax=Rheinheimera salexigens TaxID=1628148 RepID=A0A1E7Q476_9GAMM|nr:thiol reductant ABC exporter subunit CydD [Rheinheimera salexigens]OEY68936.1 thiol reductant ABC exporter subunit CydD [Rheinheimera salexigens]
MKKIKLTEPSDKPSEKTTVGASQQLNALLAPQSWLLHSALFLAILHAVFFVLQCYLLAKVFSQWLTASFRQQTLDTNALLAILPLLLLCLLARPLLQFCREQLSLIASQRCRAALRSQLLNTIASSGSAKNQYAADGSLASQVLEHVDALDGFISRYYVQRYLVLISPILLFFAILYYSKLAAVLLLVTAPLVPIFMVLLGNAATSASQQQLQVLSRMSSRFLDLMRGMATIQHLQATTRATNSVASAAERYRSSSMKVLRLAFLSTAVLEFFASLAIALLAVYLGLGLLGILPWAKGEIPVPYQGALFILLLAPEFYAPLRQLGTDYHAKAQALAAVAELQPLLQRKVWEHTGKQLLQFNSAPTITISNLRVLGEHNRPRLDLAHLSLAAGQRIVIQGASGCGKSTLLETLLGFTQYQGEVSINQQNLSQLCRTHWQQQLGYLAQTSAIMAGSIADNLRLANAQASDQQLIAVLQQVELWPLIQQLPLQLATPLGERGLGLSGGQLQRLAISQLLLRNANLWLLDEPSAHLDPDTALRIHQLLGKLSQGKTVILVSHHSAGLDWADSIIQLPQLASSSAQSLSQQVPDGAI